MAGLVDDFENLYLSGVITDFSYNLVELTNSYGHKLYMTFFPPAMNSSNAPEISSGLDLPLLPLPDVSNLPSVETMTRFWVSDDERQCDGRYKGGAWGSNNFPPTNASWIYGANLLDEILVSGYVHGIIPFQKFKGSNDLSIPIIPETEHMALSVRFYFHGGLFHGYLIAEPMNQIAVDAMVVYKTNMNCYVRCAKRNVRGPNTDIPLKLIPGSGETVEPTAGGFNVKEQLRKAVREELALSGDFSSSQVFYIGTFDAIGRDPRYDTYSVIEDGVQKTFGPPRKSITKLYFILFDSEYHEKPRTVLDDVDEAEIAKTFWMNLNKLCEVDPSEFMVPEHGMYPIIVRYYLKSHGL